MIPAGARPSTRSALARVVVAGAALVLTSCLSRVAHLNARHNAQQAVRVADRLMQQGLEDSARALYAQAAAAATVLLASDGLTPEERMRWRTLHGRAVAFAGDCTEAQSLLADAVQPDRTPADAELDVRIALAACRLREGRFADGRQQLRAFDTRRLRTLPDDEAHEASQRLALWRMRLHLHEHHDATVDSMLAVFGRPPHPWERTAALYARVQRERTVAPLVHAVRTAREPAAALSAIAQLDTATGPSARLAQLREGTDRLRMLLGTDDPSGAAAYHAGAVALEMLGNPALAVAIWLEASQDHAQSPLAPRLLWRAATAPDERADRAIERLRSQFPHSLEAALLRGDTLVADPQSEREREELLRSRWTLMERTLAERRAARTSDGR